MNNLGVIYSTSSNIAWDINKSIFYYKLTANQNRPGALFDLGNIYIERKSIEKDIKKANIIVKNEHNNFFLCIR